MRSKSASIWIPSNFLGLFQKIFWVALKIFGKFRYFTGKCGKKLAPKLGGSLEIFLCDFGWFSKALQKYQSKMETLGVVCVFEKSLWNKHWSYFIFLKGIFISVSLYTCVISPLLWDREKVDLVSFSCLFKLRDITTSNQNLRKIYPCFSSTQKSIEKYRSRFLFIGVSYEHNYIPTYFE